LTWLHLLGMEGEGNIPNTLGSRIGWRETIPYWATPVPRRCWGFQRTIQWRRQV